MQPHSVAVPQCWQDAHFSATHIVQCAARLCWAVSPSASWGVLSATESFASSHDMLALAIINCPQNQFTISCKRTRLLQTCLQAVSI